MTTMQLEKMLTAELVKLNKEIDRRICLGLSYAREAREHKMVLARLMRLKQEMRSNAFSRFSFASGLFK